MLLLLIVVVVVVVVFWPGIHIVWISAANIYLISSLAVDTGLKGRIEMILKTLFYVETHDQRDSQHLQVGSYVEDILRNEAVKVTVDSLNTEHGTGAPNIWLHSPCLDHHQ